MLIDGFTLERTCFGSYSPVQIAGHSKGNQVAASDDELAPSPAKVGGEPTSTPNVDTDILMSLNIVFGTPLVMHMLWLQGRLNSQCHGSSYACVDFFRSKIQLTLKVFHQFGTYAAPAPWQKEAYQELAAVICSKLTFIEDATAFNSNGACHLSKSADWISSHRTEAH